MPVGPIKIGAAVLGHEVAVEQPQDGLLGDAFGEVEVVLLERLAFRQAGAVNPPFQGSLPTDGDFFADQGGQHVAAWKLRCGPPD